MRCRKRGHRAAVAIVTLAGRVADVGFANPMNIRYPFTLAISVALLVCGCASSNPKITRSSPEDQRAIQVFGGATNLFFLTVPSRGPIDDTLVSGLSAAGPSAFSRQIGE